MALKSIPMYKKGPSGRRIKWYISDNSLLYPRCHACSIEPSLVDNLLLKMQTPCLSSTTKRCKKGDGKMCLQVLQWQYKIFKIPKCLSEIKKLTTTRQQPAWNMSPKNQTTFANLEISLQSLSKYRFLLRSTYSFQKMVWLWQFKNLFKNLKELPILVIPSGWNIEEKQKQENAIDEKNRQMVSFDNAQV